MNYEWHSQNYTSDDGAGYHQQNREDSGRHPMDGRRNGLVDRNAEKYYHADLKKQNSNQRNIIRSSGQRGRGKVLNKILSEGNFTQNLEAGPKNHYDPYYNNYVDDSTREGQSDAGKALQKMKNDYRERERSRGQETNGAKNSLSFTDQGLLLIDKFAKPDVKMSRKNRGDGHIEDPQRKKNHSYSKYEARNGHGHRQGAEGAR